MEIGYDSYYPWGDGVASNRGACTLTAAGLWNGRHVYITASHCSRSPGQDDNTAYYRPANGPEFGRKIYDPPYSYTKFGTYGPAVGSCFSGFVCRIADVAFISDPGGRDWGGPYAATTQGLPDGGNLLLANVFGARITNDHGGDGSGPGWTGIGYSGMPVLKVGRTTGTTTGNVTKTCFDIKFTELQTPAPISFTCQFTVTPKVFGVFGRKGDSGSPVLTDRGDGTYWITGIFSAIRSGTSDQDLYVYTPWQNVITEEVQSYSHGSYITSATHGIVVGRR